jgi:hypothetical protein
MFLHQIFILTTPRMTELGHMNTPVCTAKPPNQCSPSELEEFVAFVLAGGEVASLGLAERVRKAHSLAYLKVGDCLVGVAGLKLPSEKHRNEVSSGAGINLSEELFPLELGWVFVLPSARGGKSYRLCEPLVAAANGAGVFATSRAGNKPMHSTLEKLGFIRQGGAWPSGQNPDNLWLFARNTA